MDTILAINPPDVITFQGPFNKTVQEPLVFTNKIGKTLIYKIVSTSPKIILADPALGYILPSGKTRISIIYIPIIMRKGATNHAQATSNDVDDKIVVNVRVCDSNEVGQDVGSHWKALDQMSNKANYQQYLKVVVKDDTLVDRLKAVEQILSDNRISSDEDVIDLIENSGQYKEFDNKYYDYQASDSTYSKMGLDRSEEVKLKNDLSMADRELKSVKKDRYKLNRVHREADKARSRIEADLKASAKRGIRQRMRTMYAIQIFFLLFVIVLISYWVEEFLMRYVINVPPSNKRI